MVVLVVVWWAAIVARHQLFIAVWFAICRSQCQLRVSPSLLLIGIRHYSELNRLGAITCSFPVFWCVFNFLVYMSCNGCQRRQPLNMLMDTKIMQYCHPLAR